MARPTPGKPYIVESGDTYETIAEKAYGDSTLSGVIERSNQSENKAGIKIGEQILIPELPERTLRELSPVSGSAADRLTFKAEGEELILDSLEVVRQVDAGAYGFSGVYPWTPGENTNIDELLKPYRYPKVKIYIGDENIFSGVLYNPASSKLDSGIVKNIQGASFTADAMDSTIKPPYEMTNTTLEQRARELIQPIEITLEIEGDIDTGGAFDRITAEPGDKIFEHLVKLATQRGVLLSTNAAGNMVIKKAGSGASVGTLQEGDGIVTEWSGNFDGRKRFNSYRAIGQSPGANSKPAISNDPQVPRTRFLTFTLNDTTSGDIKNAAEWKRSKQLAAALTISLPVNTWFDPAGKLWRENTIVTVISETLSLPNGFDFLIKAVRLNYSKSAKSAVLDLVPPQVYTGEPIIDPWRS